MNQAGYFETKQQFSPTTLAMIVALHAAAIGTAILWKVGGIPFKPPITEVTFYPAPKDPPPHPTQPDTRTRPHPDEVSPRPITIPNIQQETVLTDPRPFEPLTFDDRLPKPPDPTPTVQSARAKGDVRTLITPDDYPDAARRHDETGTVRARLEIGANGSVTGCSIVASSGSAALDSATCRVLRARAHFTPAKDSSGQAVADSYVTPRIVWKIEGDG
jgi:protein TonB